MQEPPGHPCAIARRSPALREAPARLPCASATLQVRKEERHDAPKLLLECLQAFDLAGQRHAKRRSEVDNAPVLVLGRPGLEAQRAGLEVELAALEREHLGFAPTVRVGDRILHPRDTLFSDDQSIPATLSFQTTNPVTNQITGSPNVRVAIPPGGSQSFIISVLPTAPISSTDVAFDFSGSNVFSQAPLIGTNTLLLTASTVVTPDIVALALSGPPTPGVVDIPGTTGTGLLVVASVNVGASGFLT